MYKSLVILKMILTLVVTVGSAQKNHVVKVSDFGAKANDSRSDISAIQKALKYAKKINAKELVFEAGTYDLFVGDASKNVAIEIIGFNHFTLKGAVDEKGDPATTFLRHYNFRNDLSGKPILAVIRSKDFRLQNFIFDNSPRYSTAGEVIANDGRSITLKIFEGNPVIDGTLFFTGNLWNISTRTLKKVASPTYGGDVYKRIKEYTWHVVGDPADRIMKLNSPAMASKTTVGDGISWNFSYKGIQVNFYMCDDLSVENVWTYNAIGFCMRAEACENIVAKKIKIKAPGNQLSVGSRDGWKLYACRGTVIMEDLYMEGIRWDGQNVHGSFLWPYQIINKNTIWLQKKKGAAFPVPAGSKVGFWDGNKEVLRTVEKSQLKLTREHTRGFILTFSKAIPYFVNKKTLCQVYGWNIDHYILRNSTFRNIAGCASLIRNTNVDIINNTFDHIMYPAIMIGAAVHEGEGVVPRNINIRNNQITNSGWMPRQGVAGAIGIRNQESGERLVLHDGGACKIFPHTSPPISNIRVAGNTIMQCSNGIVAIGAAGLCIEKNKFIRVKNPIKADDKNNKDVVISGNDIKM